LILSGDYISGTDGDAAQVGIQDVGKLIASQQIGGQGLGGAVLIKQHGERLTGGLHGGLSAEAQG